MEHGPVQLGLMEPCRRHEPSVEEASRCVGYGKTRGVTTDNPAQDLCFLYFFPVAIDRRQLLGLDVCARFRIVRVCVLTGHGHGAVEQLEGKWERLQGPGFPKWPLTCGFGPGDGPLARGSCPMGWV